MTTALFSRAPDQGLRPLDLRRDLSGAAALMNICFGSGLDAQGRGAVHEMEWLARSGPFLWVVGSIPNAWQLGFVWIEDGKVIGNINTQASEGDAATWLIANVAVHPDYRRRGIARALTEAAVELAVKKGARQIMLQVNRENESAQRIYETLGFKTTATHTLWERTSGTIPQPINVEGIELRHAPHDKWQISYEFARRFRPEGLSWVRPLQERDWQTSWWRWLSNFLSGQREETWWAIETATNTLVGLFTVNAGFHSYEEIVMILYPDYRSRLERMMLIAAIRRLRDRAWTIRLDHPVGEAEEPLRELGFRDGAKLVWMVKKGNEGDKGNKGN